MTGVTQNPVNLSGLNCVCARNTHLMRRRGGERDADTHARARLGLSFRRTLMIGRGMSGIKGLVSSRISNSLTTPWHMAQPGRPGAGKGTKPRGASLPLGQSTPHKENLLLRSEALCFFCCTIPSHDFHVSLFHSRWMEFQCFSQYYSLVYPPFLLSNTLSIPVGRFGYVFFFLLWAWGCASIVNHGLVPGTRCNGYIANGMAYSASPIGQLFTELKNFTSYSHPLFAVEPCLASVMPLVHLGPSQSPYPFSRCPGCSDT